MKLTPWLLAMLATTTKLYTAKETDEKRDARFDKFSGEPEECQDKDIAPITLTEISPSNNAKLFTATQGLFKDANDLQLQEAMTHEDILSLFTKEAQKQTEIRMSIEELLANKKIMEIELQKQSTEYSKLNKKLSHRVSFTLSGRQATAHLMEVLNAGNNFISALKAEDDQQILKYSNFEIGMYNAIEATKSTLINNQKTIKTEIYEQYRKDSRVFCENIENTLKSYDPKIIDANEAIVKISTINNLIARHRTLKKEINNTEGQVQQINDESTKLYEALSISIDNSNLFAMQDKLLQFKDKDTLIEDALGEEIFKLLKGTRLETFSNHYSFLASAMQNPETKEVLLQLSELNSADFAKLEKTLSIDDKNYNKENYLKSIDEVIKLFPEDKTLIFTLEVLKQHAEDKIKLEEQVNWFKNLSCRLGCLIALAAIAHIVAKKNLQTLQASLARYKSQPDSPINRNIINALEVFFSVAKVISLNAEILNLQNEIQANEKEKQSLKQIIDKQQNITAKIIQTNNDNIERANQIIDNEEITTNKILEQEKKIQTLQELNFKMQIQSAKKDKEIENLNQLLSRYKEERTNLKKHKAFITDEEYDTKNISRAKVETSEEEHHRVAKINIYLPRDITNEQLEDFHGQIFENLQSGQFARKHAQQGVKILNNKNITIDEKNLQMAEYKKVGIRGDERVILGVEYDEKGGSNKKNIKNIYVVKFANHAEIEKIENINLNKEQYTLYKKEIELEKKEKIQTESDNEALQEYQNTSSTAINPKTFIGSKSKID